ncbi:antitoxin [Caulobacter sp. DWP3-1-3b2]|uniref:antitoxin n=1 Tax=Caulobacter sp. DWP3-1-3b2 TaxID=2804643 RepID=UPI003CFB6D3D
MADGEITLKIDEALAASLKARAAATGQSIEAVAVESLDLMCSQDRGFNDSAAHWDEIQRIVDETERDGGIPLEDVERWVASWDTDNELPPPEPRPRTAGR